jgi:hypothetical protein
MIVPLHRPLCFLASHCFIPEYNNESVLLALFVLVVEVLVLLVIMGMSLLVLRVLGCRIAACLVDYNHWDIIPRALCRSDLCLYYNNTYYSYSVLQYRHGHTLHRCRDWVKDTAIYTNGGRVPAANETKVTGASPAQRKESEHSSVRRTL